MTLAFLTFVANCLSKMHKFNSALLCIKWKIKKAMLMPTKKTVKTNPIFHNSYERSRKGSLQLPKHKFSKQ